VGLIDARVTKHAPEHIERDFPSIKPRRERISFMIGQTILPSLAGDRLEAQPKISAPRKQRSAGPISLRLPEYQESFAPLHHAELFYLQKQIQSQTPMVIVMEDGETIEGCIEWYDRCALKVRGRSRMLIYKSAIKFMYKQGENG
jgi:sRNA-binding regulator protein Hfq